MKITVTMFRKESKDYNSNGVGYTLEAEHEEGYSIDETIKDLEEKIERQYTRRANATKTVPVQQGSGNNSQVAAAPKQAYVRPPVSNTQNTPQTGGTIVSTKQMQRLYAIANSKGLVDAYKAFKMQMGVIDGKAGTNCTKEQYKELEKLLGV